ncbi:MAG: hypothetical protein K2G47_08560 [Muribaculum sp.]|nr:hypothetical protein [Muribaculum sp.]
MKRLMLFIYHFFYFVLCFSQERSFDIVGLADGDEIIDALKLGIPLIVLGLLIVYIPRWRKSDKENQDEKGSTIGCIGMVIIGIGFLILIPLWTWVETIVVTLVSVVFVLAIIFLIVSYVYDELKK